MLQRRDIDSVGSDEAVIATNDDASSCKRCAVALGYWRDRYINYFVRSTDRKAPEINRGYFARSVAIKMLVDKFIEVCSRGFAWPCGTTPWCCQAIILSR